MSKDFNSDMFSAILKANEKSMALLEGQLAAAQKQAKRKDIIFCITLSIMALLLGGMIWAYSQKKVSMNVDYDQGTQESQITESTLNYNNEVKTD